MFSEPVALPGVVSFDPELDTVSEEETPFAPISAGARVLVIVVGVPVDVSEPVTTVPVPFSDFVGLVVVISVGVPLLVVEEADGLVEASPEFVLAAGVVEVGVVAKVVGAAVFAVTSGLETVGVLETAGLESLFVVAVVGMETFACIGAWVAVFFA